MARIYVDEQLGNFVEPLAQAGHDVAFAGAAGRQGRSDAWHFREAIDDRRVIVTFNRGDFTYLHRLWTTLRTLHVVDSSHSGLLTAAASRTFTPAAWLPVLLPRLAEPAEGLTGRMLRWIPREQDWREDDSRPED